MSEGRPRMELERRAAEAAARLPDLIAAADHAAQIVTAGRHPRQKAGRSDTFWQFRDYAHGDPVSAIDWRQSARLDRRLLVRQTEWEQPQTIFLWCGGGDDFDYGSAGEPKRFRGQVLSLALGILALRAGEQVGIWGDPEPPKSGVQAVPFLAEHLLRADHSITDLVARPGADVLMVSDFHDDPGRLHSAFDQVRMARGKPVAVVVEDPAEESFPFEGSRRFESPQGSLRRTFGEASAIRDEYLSAREKHHDALRAAARGEREAVFFHRTDHPTTPLLLQLAQVYGEGLL